MGLSYWLIYEVIIQLSLYYFIQNSGLVYNLNYYLIITYNSHLIKTWTLYTCQVYLGSF